MADCGIPMYSAVALFWAMTSPPIFEIARTPSEPSAPLPEHHRDRAFSEHARCGLKERISRGPQAVHAHPILVRKPTIVSDCQVSLRRRDVHSSGLNRKAIKCSNHRQKCASGEKRLQVRVLRWNPMLHDRDGGVEIRWLASEDLRETARRRSDGDEPHASWLWERQVGSIDHRSHSLVMRTSEAAAGATAGPRFRAHSRETFVAGLSSRNPMNFECRR